jgi:putative hydrolase of HD superfamily
LSNPNDYKKSNLIPASQFVDFLLIIGKLKQEKRTGWVNHNIPLAESVADHMYRMAVMGLFIRVC